MSLALLGCCIALLAAFLLMLRPKIKVKRWVIKLMVLLCLVFLVFAFIEEKPFSDKEISSRPEIEKFNHPVRKTPEPQLSKIKSRFEETIEEITPEGITKKTSRVYEEYLYDR
jgi:c-di-AMP phosphodiesterase-like protein